MTRKAVVLLSGGLDSTTVLAIAKDQGFEPYALSFRYGQRTPSSSTAAQRVAEAAGRRAPRGLRHRPARLRRVGADVRRRRPQARLGGRACDDDIPVTYVPARNTVFLSFALAYAEVDRCHRHLHRRQRPGLLRLPRLPPRVHRRLRADGEPGHPGRGRRATH